MCTKSNDGILKTDQGGREGQRMRVFVSVCVHKRERERERERATEREREKKKERNRESRKWIKTERAGVASSA